MVAVYGLAIIVFGLSRLFLLSLVALAVSGFADLFSMNIRTTTVALATPDRLRGRVSAVEMVFVSASNQLGAFESGLAAFLVGAVPAVIGGGVITVLIAVSWRRFFPDLARVDRFQDVMPAVTPAAPVAPGWRPGRQGLRSDSITKEAAWRSRVSSRSPPRMEPSTCRCGCPRRAAAPACC